MPFFPSEPYYIQSSPPTGGFFYHHSTYKGLKAIAQTRIIKASPQRRVISLTTEAGRYLSPLPFLLAEAVDGVVRIPITQEIEALAIPALYQTRRPELVANARRHGYSVFDRASIPPEYRYILKHIVHNAMFIGEDEYSILEESLAIPQASTVFVHPRYYKRMLNNLDVPITYALPIRLLTELART